MSDLKRGPYLPVAEVSDILSERMTRFGIEAEAMDRAAGYTANAGMARRILRQRVAKVDVGVAERFLRLVGAELNDCPSWISGDLLNWKGGAVTWGRAWGA